MPGSVVVLHMRQIHVSGIVVACTLIANAMGVGVIACVCVFVLQRRFK